MHTILNIASTHRRQLHIAILILLSLIGAIVAWERYIKDSFFPKNFGVVKTGQIYRSGRISPFLIKKTLMKYNIKGIISLCGDSTSNSSDNAERETAKKLGIERQIFSLRSDGTGDLNDYARGVAAICQFQKEGKPVLVHCAHGVHRAGGIIAAYRLIVQGKDADSVLSEMVRYGFDPNDDKILIVFLNQNMAVIAEKLKTIGVIEKVPSLIPVIKTD